MGVIRLDRPSHLCTSVGVVLTVVSAFLPWVTSNSAVGAFAISPVSTNVLRGSVWILLVVLAAGAMTFFLGGNTAVIGCASAVWLTTSIAFWLFEAKLIRLLPAAAMPPDGAANLGPGASLGLIGALLAVLGSVLVVAEKTWDLPVHLMPRWLAPATLAIAFLSLDSREFGWLKVTGGNLSWELGFDSVPLFGDALSAALVTAVTLLFVSILRPRRWVVRCLIGLAALIEALSLIAFTSNAVVEKLSSELLKHVGLLTNLNGTVRATKGPLVTALVGLLLAIYSIVIGRKFSSSGPSFASSTADRPTDSTNRSAAVPQDMLPF